VAREQDALVGDALGQSAEIELMCLLVPLLRAKSFVDVGAEKGAIANALFQCGLTGTLFEPLPRHLPALQALARVHSGKVYPWAITDSDDTRQFHVATNADGHELDYFHSLERIHDDARFAHSKSFDVNCRSLASLVAEGLLPNTPGILKIDTEGRDLAVLRGLGAMRPELVVCEFFTEGLYDGWKEAHPSLAIEYLRKLGYARYLAFKRVEGFEQCVVGPCGFLPRQWGNLVFFSDELFSKAEILIVRHLERAEAALVDQWLAISTDREAKESVIRQLRGRDGAGHANTVPAVTTAVPSFAVAERATTAMPHCLVSAVNQRKRKSGKLVVLDVGAHHGAFSFGMLSEFAADTVFAFEPQAANFAALKKFAIDLPQVFCLNAAVGESDGSAAFYCSEDSATGSILAYVDKPAQGLERAEVPLIALDTFCRDFASLNRDIGLIKIDTQGYDLAVLRGCEATLHQHQPIVYLEFIYANLYRDQATPHEIEAWMNARGYRLVGLANLHNGANGVIAFCDALFVPTSLDVASTPPYRQIDNEESWLVQIATLNKVCSERLVVIETLDAEVNRLRSLASSN
jgi:FkbM family methyltransferase